MTRREFEAYFQDDTAALGSMAAWMLEHAYPRATRSLVLENAPLNVEAVCLRCGTRPRRVILAPENKFIAFEWQDGWTSFQAEPLTIDSAYMIET